jgi:integrase
MSLYKRGNTWWVRFTPPNGQQIRRSAKTTNKQQAQEFLDGLRASYWRMLQLGEKPKRTWQEAVERWLEEKKGVKTTYINDVRCLRWLHSFLYNKYLDEISREDVDQIIKARLAEGVKNATVNRMMETMRAILRKAEKDWEWIDKATHIPMLPEPKRRIRWLTKVEADRLLAELPEHLAEMMRFTLATGLREANVTQLQWSQVDTIRGCAWIHPDQSKSRKAIPVPLNADALALLQRQKTYQKNTSSTFVFLFRGKPVNKANTKAWRDALVRAGIENFRWHDLRHTWATWHIQQGTPLYVLQELGGWAGPEMVQRYAHLSAEHLKVYADKLAQPKAISTKLAQSQNLVINDVVEDAVIV